MSHDDYKADIYNVPDTRAGSCVHEARSLVEGNGQPVLFISTVQLGPQTHLLSPRTQRGIDQSKLKHPIIHYHQLKRGK